MNLYETYINKSLNIESGILNLDLKDGKRNHWISLYKSNSKIVYFDSYGFTSSK